MQRVHPIWDAVSGTGDKEDCTEALRAQSLFRSPLAGANRDAAPEHAIEASASPTPTSSMGLTPAFTPANPVVGWANEGVCDGLPDSFVIAGWKRYASRSTDRPFFRNRKTGETRWTCPHCDPDSKVIRGQAAALSLDLTVVVDDADGNELIGREGARLVEEDGIDLARGRHSEGFRAHDA